MVSCIAFYKELYLEKSVDKEETKDSLSCITMPAINLRQKDLLNAVITAEEGTILIHYQIL